MIRSETTSPKPPPLPKVVSHSDAPAQVTRVLQRNHAPAVSKVVVLLSVLLLLFVCVSIGLLIQNANLRREISLRVEADLAAEEQVIDAELEERARIADAKVAEMEAAEEVRENERLEREEKLSARQLAEEVRLAELARQQAAAEPVVAKQDAEELEAKVPEEVNRVAVAKIDVNELLNAGKINLKITLVSPFGEARRIFYLDAVRPPMNLNATVFNDLGQNEYAREIRVDAIQPLTITVTPRLKDRFLKEESLAVQKEWSRLKAEVTAWNKRFPTMKVNLNIPTKNDDFHSCRQRLTAWEIQHDDLSKRIDEVEAELASRQSPESYRAQSRGLEEARSQLDRIHERYSRLIEAMDAIANETVYESGPVFYTSDGNEPMIPPGIEGREPFQFKYTIEYPVNSPLSTPVVEPVIPESNSPYIPQGQPLP